MVSSESKTVPPVLSAVGDEASGLQGASSDAGATCHFGTETHFEASARSASDMSLHCAARHDGHHDFNSRWPISFLYAAGEGGRSEVDDLTMVRFRSPG
jgi:hypothetical protein